MRDPAPRSPRPRAATCPTCGATVRWTGNPHRPFCSAACRLVDLGGWLDERHRIAGPAIAPEAETPDVP